MLAGEPEGESRVFGPDGCGVIPVGGVKGEVRLLDVRPAADEFQGKARGRQGGELRKVLGFGRVDGLGLFPEQNGQLVFQQGNVLLKNKPLVPGGFQQLLLPEDIHGPHLPASETGADQAEDILVGLYLVFGQGELLAGGLQAKPGQAHFGGQGQGSRPVVGQAGLGAVGFGPQSRPDAAPQVYLVLGGGPELDIFDPAKSGWGRLMALWAPPSNWGQRMPFSRFNTNWACRNRSQAAARLKLRVRAESISPSSWGSSNSSHQRCGRGTSPAADSGCRESRPVVGWMLSRDGPQPIKEKVRKSRAKRENT